jgi:hypothetical protein
MAARNYSDLAPPVPLTATVQPNDVSWPVTSTAGYPTPPFTLASERGTANQELALCTGISGAAFQVTRRIDGGPSVVHASGTPVEHCVGALDYHEANQHINDTTRDDHTSYLTVPRHDVHDHTGVPGAGGVARAHRMSFTYAVSGPVSNLTLPLFEVGLAASETKTLVQVTTRVSSGSITGQLRVNGANVGGAISVTTTKLETAFNTALGNGDDIDVVLSAGASPTDLTFTIKVDSVS